MLDEYLNKLKALGKSDNTIKTYRTVLKALNNFKSLDKITKLDLIEFFKNLEGTDETRRTYQAKIKKFYTDNEKPEIVKWIKLVTPKDKLKANDILTTEDINKMIEATNSDYWKAWISFAFETGARFSEIRALKYKDFKETNEGIIVDIPTTKTASGFRRVILNLSANSYINLKRYKNATDDDIVFKLKEPWTLKALNDIAKRAGIKKPVNPHAFRHAQATILVQLGMQEAIIRKKLGWTPTSPMIARYQHLDDNDVVEATLRLNGKTPKKLVITELVQPEIKPNLVDNAMKLSKLEIENEELKKQHQELNTKVELMIKLLNMKQPSVKDLQEEAYYKEIHDKEPEPLIAGPGEYTKTYKAIESYRQQLNQKDKDIKKTTELHKKSIKR